MDARTTKQFYERLMVPGAGSKVSESSLNSTQALLEKQNQEGRAKHIAFIADAKNKSYKNLEGQIWWLRHLATVGFEELPKIGDESVFDALTQNTFITATEKAELACQLMSRGYDAYSPILFKSRFFEYVLSEQNWLPWIKHQFFSFLQAKQLTDLHRMINGKTIEESILEKIISQPESAELCSDFEKLLLHYYDNSSRLIKFINMWFNRLETAKQAIALYEYIKSQSGKTPLSHHASLLLKIAKQTLLNVLITKPTQHNNADEIKVFLSEHRNGILSGGFGDTSSLQIFTLLGKGEIAEAKKQFVAEKVKLAAELQKLEIPVGQAVVSLSGRP